MIKIMKTINLTFVLLMFSILSLSNMNAQTTDLEFFNESSENIFRNDFFFDAMVHVGHGSYYYEYTTIHYEPIRFYGGVMSGGFSKSFHTNSHKGAGKGFGLKLGNKWYFGKNKKYRPGFTATWLRVDFQSLGVDQNNFSFSLLPNIGFINAFKFNQNMGIEVNMNTGLKLIFVPNRIFFAAAINPNVKLRYKALTVGIDLNYMPTIGAVKENHFLQFGLSVGCVLGKQGRKTAKKYRGFTS
jgi:hypothetical protein